jgi:methoxymalonate biosynthesis acyl carrier protein
MQTHENPGVKDAIRTFIHSSVAIPKLADDDDLFAGGIVNSLFAIQLVTFIEKKFGLELQTEDLEMRNFRSLNAATEFVLSKKQGA